MLCVPPPFALEEDCIMKIRVEERNRARELRRRGYSYGEIRRTVLASKSTLNGWLRDVELTVDLGSAIPRAWRQAIGWARRILSQSA